MARTRAQVEALIESLAANGNAPSLAGVLHEYAPVPHETLALALTAGITNDRAECVHMLLAGGAHVTLCALSMCVHACAPAALNILLAQANTRQLDPILLRTAIDVRQYECLRLLVRYGINVHYLLLDPITRDEMCLVDYALWYKRDLTATRILIDMGAHVGTMEWALTYHMYHRRISLVHFSFALEHSANVWDVWRVGTSLHERARHCAQINRALRQTLRPHARTTCTCRRQQSTLAMIRQYFKCDGFDVHLLCIDDI